MAGEDKILRLENGLTTIRAIEDNLHSYTNTTSSVAVGDVVYQDSVADNKVAIADANNASVNIPIGMVVEITDPTNCVVCHMGGIATGLSGLTRGEDYWLSTAGTSGNTITTIKPSSNAYCVGVALSATTMLISVTPFDTASSGGGISGAHAALTDPTTSTQLADFLDQNYRQLIPSAGTTVSLYVATTGSDATGDGSVGNPFATIQRALQLSPVFNDATNRVTLNIGSGSFLLPRVTVANYVNFQGTTSALETLTISAVTKASDIDGIVLDVTSTGGPYLADQLRGSRISWTSGSSSLNTGWIYRNDATIASTTKIYATQDSGSTTGINSMAISDTIDIISLDTTVNLSGATILQGSVQMNMKELKISATSTSKLFVLNTDKVEFSGVYFDGSAGFLTVLRSGGMGRIHLTDSYYASAGTGSDPFLSAKNGGYLQIGRGTVLDASLNAIATRRRVEGAAGSLVGFLGQTVVRGFDDGTIFEIDGTGIFQANGKASTTTLLVEDSDGALSSQIGPVFTINTTGEGQGGWYQLPSTHGSISGNYLVTATGGAWVSLGGSDTFTSPLGSLKVSADGGASNIASNSDFTYISGGSPDSSGSIFMPEKASASPSVAGRGQVWVKNTTPSLLFYTDDAGTDHDISSPSDHGTLIGLGGDDHTQYLSLTGGTARNQLTGGVSLSGQMLVNGIIDVSTGGLTLPQGLTPTIVTGEFNYKTTNQRLYYGDGTSALRVANYSELFPNIITASNLLVRTEVAAASGFAESGISLDPSDNLSSISSLQLNLGASINEFSIDGALAGDSDTAIPTEKAVKTYVDAVSAEDTWDGTRIWLEKPFDKDVLAGGATALKPGYDPVFALSQSLTGSSVQGGADSGPLILSAVDNPAYVAIQATGGSSADGFGAGVWAGNLSAYDNGGWLTGKRISFKLSCILPSPTSSLTGSRIAFGFSPNINNIQFETGTDNMYVRYGSGYSPNWNLVTYNAGVKTATDTGIPVALGVRYVFELNVSAAFEVSLKINGTTVVSGATNLVNSVPTTFLGYPTILTRNTDLTVSQIGLYKIGLGRDI